MNAKKAFLLGCGGALAIALIAGILLVAFVWHVAEDTEGISVEVVAPDEVKVGDTFDLTIIVKNERTGKNLKVDDLDLSDEYLAGFLVAETKPKHKSTTHVPIDNSQSFTFGATLKPQETNHFVFSLKAHRAGLFRGDVDVTEGLRFVSALLQTVVKEKE